MSEFGIASIVPYFPRAIQDEAAKVIALHGMAINEFRLRVGRPAVALLYRGKNVLVGDKPVTSDMLHETLEKMCDYSVYSRQNELAQGFLTLPGGHRVGVCGEASFDKCGNRVIKYISSLNIRIASEHIGCSEKLMTALYPDKVVGTLLVGPPCSGKTTLLKDFALKLSSPPFSHTTVLIDERNELAAMYRGIPQSTLGACCDVLSGYPKAEGILLALRTLSPEIIVCDEIGGRGEAKAVCDVLNAGVVMIASAHACNADELYRREPVRKLLHSGAFEKIALLKAGFSRCELDRIIEVGQYGI